MEGVGKVVVGVACTVAMIAGLMLFFTTVSRNDRERLDSLRSAEASRTSVAPPLGEIRLTRPVRPPADLRRVTGVGVTAGGWVRYTSSSWRIAFPGQPKHEEITDEDDPNNDLKSFEVSHTSQAGLFYAGEVGGPAGWINGLDHGSKIYRSYISDSNGTDVSESDVQLAGTNARRIGWTLDGVAVTTFVVTPSRSRLILLEAYGANPADTDAFAGAFAMVPA